MFETSLELLRFHSVAYSIYALLIISVIAWFGVNLVRKEKVKPVVRIPFYGYIAFLVVAGVGHHIFTYNAIPWVEEDIKRHKIKPDRVFLIEIENHKWKLPKEKMVAKEGERVLFDVRSKDLTYGFGLFRKDGTMVTQMQVVPKYKNDLLWTFRECGKFDLTSTEYSGPFQYDLESGEDKMFIKDAVIIECADKKVALK
jgi:cytochrome c oxidase subunit 2